MIKNTVALVTLGLSVLTAYPFDAMAQGKSWDWQDIRAGDCHLTGTLSILPNGTGTWTATTYTDKTHTGDYWHISIGIMDQNQAALFNVGQFNSPRMDDGNPPPRYSWSNAFNFDASKFPIATYAQPTSSC